MVLVGLGALFFGVMVGWIAYRILRLRAGTPGLSDLIALAGVIAGAAVLALLRSDVGFGWYAIGLVLGFLAYLAIGVGLYGRQEVLPWRPEPVSPPSVSAPQEEASLAPPED